MARQPWCDLNVRTLSQHPYTYALLRTETCLKRRTWLIPRIVGGMSVPRLDPCSRASAVASWSREYDKGPRALLWASSECGYRAAAVCGSGRWRRVLAMKVFVNPPKTPVTEGSRDLAAATLPNVCKMPGPPAPFVPTPLPNIGKSGDKLQKCTTKVSFEGKKVAVKGSYYMSMGDIASKGTGGGLQRLDARQDGVRGARVNERQGTGQEHPVAWRRHDQQRGNSSNGTGTFLATCKPRDRSQNSRPQSERKTQRRSVRQRARRWG